MNQARPINLLILEDDEIEINKFKNCINSQKDFKLICSTNSCFEALEYIKNNNIECVIVDIELNKGIGDSGLQFISDLNALKLDIKPIIIVTTKISSERVHSIAHELGADMSFCKTKSDYSAEAVLSNIKILRPSLKYDIPLSTIEKINNETREYYVSTLSDRIKSELDLIGIRHHLKGRKYLEDAIYYLIESNDNNRYYTNFLVDKYKLKHSSINNAIQAAINNAWRNSPPSELEKHFLANISYKNGAPTPTEFIHYYVDKIKRTLK